MKPPNWVLKLAEDQGPDQFISSGFNYFRPHPTDVPSVFQEGTEVYKGKNLPLKDSTVPSKFKLEDTVYWYVK